MFPSGNPPMPGLGRCFASMQAYPSCMSTCIGVVPGLELAIAIAFCSSLRCSVTDKTREGSEG